MKIHLFSFVLAALTASTAQALPPYRLRILPGPSLAYIDFISNDGTYAGGEQAVFSSYSYIYSSPYLNTPAVMPYTPRPGWNYTVVTDSGLGILDGQYTYDVKSNQITGTVPAPPYPYALYQLPWMDNSGEITTLVQNTITGAILSGVYQHGAYHIFPFSAQAGAILAEGFSMTTDVIANVAEPNTSGIQVAVNRGALTILMPQTDTSDVDFPWFNNRFGVVTGGRYTSSGSYAFRWLPGTQPQLLQPVAPYDFCEGVWIDDQGQVLGFEAGEVTGYVLWDIDGNAYSLNSLVSKLLGSRVSVAGAVIDQRGRIFGSCSSPAGGGNFVLE